MKTIKTVLFLQQCTSRDLTLLQSCAAWWGSGPILATLRGGELAYIGHTEAERGGSGPILTTLRGGEWAHIGHTGVCVSALHVRQQKQYFTEQINQRLQHH